MATEKKDDKLAQWREAFDKEQLSKLEDFEKRVYNPEWDTTEEQACERAIIFALGKGVYEPVIEQYGETDFCVTVRGKRYKIKLVPVSDEEYHKDDDKKVAKLI